MPLGNTKPMASNTRSRKWTVTVFDVSEENVQKLKDIFTQKHWTFIFGHEICPTTNRPHLQGYIEHKNAISFDTLKKIMPDAHLEKARGTDKDNFNYCSKEGKIALCNMKEPISAEEEYDEYMHSIYDDVKWFNWQSQIIDIVNSKPDRRTVHWFWEHEGNVGKSFLVQYLDWHNNAIIANGKQSDVFNQYKTFIEENKKQPTLALIDIPRSHKDYICYSTFEKIKDGVFYSGKYEGGKLRLVPHHLIVFANFEPDYSKLSEDRWKVHEINSA